MKIQIQTTFWQGLDKEQVKTITNIVTLLSMPNLMVIAAQIIWGSIGTFITVTCAIWLAFGMIINYSANKYLKEAK